MPPKKKKSTPMVVGTVSTRSTRRESIVNIEIIPKANKSTTRTPSSKKTPQKPLQTPNKKELAQEKIAEFEKTSPEILEILKDWSDDENSQDTNFIEVVSISSNSKGAVADKNKHNSSSLPVDQQSLIDILEGNHSEAPQIKSFKNTLKYQIKKKTLPTSNRSTLAKETIENPIVDVDSPKVEESEIIEECVVEDDSIIIELPEEQMETTSQDPLTKAENRESNEKDISTLDNKLGGTLKPQGQCLAKIAHCHSDTTEKKMRSPESNIEMGKNNWDSSKKKNKFDVNQKDKEVKMIRDIYATLQEVKQPGGEVEENLKISPPCEINEDSMTSEDTTSQSMITVQDEEVSDINDIQISDNSTSSCEVIEEQVFDTSESVIIENEESIHSEKTEKNDLSEDGELILGLQKGGNDEKKDVENLSSSSHPLDDVGKTNNSDDLSKNLLEKQYKSVLQDVSTTVKKFSDGRFSDIHHVSNISSDSDLLKDNQKKTSKEEWVLITQEAHGEKFLQSNNDPLSLAQKSPAKLGNANKEESDENNLVLDRESIKVEPRDRAPNNSVPTSSLKVTENSQNASTDFKTHDQYLKTSKVQAQAETKSLDNQFEENALCQQINELMDISKESSLNIKELDMASDKLQEGIQKMFIQEKEHQTELTSKTAKNTGDQNNKSKSLIDNIKYVARDSESKKLKFPSIQGQERKIPAAKGTEGEKSLESDKTPMSSDQKSVFGIDIKQRRRSTRRKAIEDETQHLEIYQREEPAKLPEITDRGILNIEKNIPSHHSSQDKSSKALIDKDRSVEKEVEELHKVGSRPKIFEAELNADQEFKSSRHSTSKSKKTLRKLTLHLTKMDIDSESSEAKTSENEGDSTSNESSQSSNSTKMFETRAETMLLKQTEELDKMDIDSSMRSIQSKVKSDLSKDTSTDDNNQNRKPKEAKTKNKKASRRVGDEEMHKMDIDLDKSLNLPLNSSSTAKLQADIDATINDVLRKYTQDESGTPEECASPKELKMKVARPAKESKKKKEVKCKRDEKYETSEEVRRSDRIKTIVPVKKKSHGLVRSKSEPALSVEAENSDSNSVHSELDKITPVSPQLTKKSKTKSKAKSSENLQIMNSSGVGSLLPENSPQLPKSEDLKTDACGKAEIEARLKSFAQLKENQYKTDRQVCKEAREMVCDCYLAEEDIEKDEYGCGEDCLNRLLMIECGHLCQVGHRCTNKRFQKGQFAPLEVFKTEKKGLGLIAAANIPYGEFILEYVGEVLNPDEFEKRAEVYSKDKNIHFYFMSLRNDAIIDATMKGNISRFINHSCDPNAETQKWTVNGELRIGFFSTRTILAGEEVTFDYKFQRYGKEAQKCYCGAASCRGWLGEQPDESEDEDEEEEEESTKVEEIGTSKAEVKVLTPEILETEQDTRRKELAQKKPIDLMEIDTKAEVTEEVKVPQETPATPQVQEPAKKISKKKPRKELLFEDFDQLNEDIDMVVTTGLKNQAHTLKLSRLMVRAKDLDQRKKLLRVLRRGELPCRRLFLDYHGLRLMHGYMIDAQQLTNSDKKLNYFELDFLQTKLELLQTLAVLPIQNKTMLIESKVLPAVEKWAKNEDVIEDGSDQRDAKKSDEEVRKRADSKDPAVNEKIDEIKFLASKLLEEWFNMKESFRIPKKQRIEQMKEHEKEANRKFVENSYAQERESSRKNDQRYRTWSRYKSERETNKKGYREDKERPSAEYLKMSKQERRKLFALQMELKEEERRLKQREMWRQHEMNCMLIGADPRFTAPFDPSKGFQYIWNPAVGQWQALPFPSTQNQGVYNSPATSQGVAGYNVPPTHKATLLGPYASPLLNVSGITGPTQQYPGMQPNIAPMVPGLPTSVANITNTVPGMTAAIPGITGLVPGMPGPLHGLSGSTPVMAGSVPGITQPPLPALPMFPEPKQQEEDLSQVRFAGPIPPPAKLPPKWKCAKDKYGRPYYYHIKIRKSQWEPPPVPEEAEEYTETSSSETSSLTSSDSSSDSDTDDEIDDTKLLMEVRKQMETTSKFTLKSVIPQHVKKEEKDSATPSPDGKVESDNEDEPIEEFKEEIEDDNTEQLSSIDIRLKEQFNLDSSDPPKKKRRIGLCQEIIISPRTEEDRQQFKEDLKRYKATKEKLKRQKEQMLIQTKKKLKTSSSSSTSDGRRSKDKRLLKSTAKSRIKQMEWNDEHAKKIKEVFRSTMATTVVSVLNAYRKPDCKESRITNTEDFKHLARKLTHFVMLKEMKHIDTIEELICTDNVKAKAREYIKKYMSKFGEVYQKRHDEPDFKD